MVELWSIQIDWNGRWVTVATGFASRDEAETASALWKQQNLCHGDPFRRVRIEVPANRPAERSET